MRNMIAYHDGMFRERYHYLIGNNGKCNTDVTEFMTFWLEAWGSVDLRLMA